MRVALAALAVTLGLSGSVAHESHASAAPNAPITIVWSAGTNGATTTSVITTTAVIQLDTKVHKSTHHVRKPHAVVRVPVPIAVPLVWRTYGPGISYPDRTDPTRLLPRIDQLAFACIRRFESRNHPVDGNAWASGAGWYQFSAGTWHSFAVAMHYPARLMWDANLATHDQQSAGAVWYWNRNRRFGVQWKADAYKGCPGAFFF